MDKPLVSLHVMGLSYSQLQGGAYALLLAEDDGPRRIPVIIGAAEAQSIGVILEGLNPSRPLTHDLFVSFAHAFGVKLKKVYIYRFEDGIFSSELTFADGEGRSVVLDARTSDAIALALRTRTPIYTSQDIIERAGFIIVDNDLRRPDADTAAGLPPENNNTLSGHTYADRTDYHADPKPENYSIEQLERTLEELIRQENYEDAARISEILDMKKNKDKDNNENS